MTKEELVDLIRKVLRTETNLDFLLSLQPEELETLIICVRDKIEKEKEELYPLKVNQREGGKVWKWWKIYGKNLRLFKVETNGGGGGYFTFLKED